MTMSPHGSPHGSPSRSPWRAAVLLAGGLLLAPLAGCGQDTDPGAEGDGPAATATEQTQEPAETASPSPDATGSDVDCSRGTCSLTLTGDRQAEILGTTISLGGVRDGQATLAVGDAEVSCRQGERVSAGPLSLECTTVTADSVTLTASLG